MKNVKCFVMLLCATLFFASCKDNEETTISVATVSINEDYLALTTGSTGVLTTTINPEDATNPTVKWSSNKTDVATVDATGKVTAVEEGTAIITVTTADGGKTASCAVIVTLTPDRVSGVTLNKTGMLIPLGKSETLVATITPTGATNPSIAWSTDNEAIATVDAAGKVTAVSAGIANITATSSDRGKTATCRVVAYPNRTIRLEGPAEGKVWGEEMGEITVPLIFENGELDELPITGKITVANLVGCTKDDFTLETTDFTSMGDETQYIKIKVKDNDKFGEWSFELLLTDVSMAAPLTQPFVVNIKDDERVLGFKGATYEVTEGKSVNIIPFLYGGNAANNVPLNITVVTDETTAIPQQYSLPTSFNAIYINTNASSFTVRTFQHPSLQDAVLTLKITTTATTLGTGKLLYNETQYCKVIIKDTDHLTLSPE